MDKVDRNRALVKLSEGLADMLLDNGLSLFEFCDIMHAELSGRHDSLTSTAMDVDSYEKGIKADSLAVKFGAFGDLV